MTKLFIRIINSLLDIDRYKFTMSQFVFFFYRDVEVKYAFTNRTKSNNINAQLLYLKPFIIKEIEYVKNHLRFSYMELLHLKNQSIFKDEYLEALSKMELPAVDVFEKDGILHIETFGKWWITMIWETIILAIVAELYARHTAVDRFAACKENNDQETFGDLEKYNQLALNGDVEFLELIMEPYYKNAMILLEEKIKNYLRHPTIVFFEFGTRRRFSAKLQDMVVKRLNEAFHKPQFIGSSQFLGTSNEYLAMKHGIKAGGTMAHEMFMVIAGLNNKYDQHIIDSQYDFLRDWNGFYGYDLSVALTDTFGSDYFFAHCPKDIANMYSFREDSAIDLCDYTDSVLNLYKKNGVNHNEKVIVHSNGLNQSIVISQDSYSQGKIKKVYGQGTDLTCDVGFDFKHLSMVVKAVGVMVDKKIIPLVKLSDNIAKAICDDSEQLQRYKDIFEYTNEKSIAQVY